ncbi:MAG: helix-hairpin-helix domain-containing protein [Campylobacterota bacterium]|nr:helix-hairpin-helix domain-containing protein [Campylobacterota bacterium]
MKNPNRKTVSKLDELPNIGKAMAGNLQMIGIDHPKKLIGKEPFELYETLCEKRDKRQDPCVIDVFMSVVHFMEGGDPLPWWSFTDERKHIASSKEK